MGAPAIHTKPTHWPYGATAVPNRPPWVVRCALQGRWGHILENRVICRERAGKCSKCREQSRESSWFFPAGRSREKPGAKPGMPGASREKPGIREQAQKPGLPAYISGSLGGCVCASRGAAAGCTGFVELFYATHIAMRWFCSKHPKKGHFENHR